MAGTSGVGKTETALALADHCASRPGFRRAIAYPVPPEQLRPFTDAGWVVLEEVAHYARESQEIPLAPAIGCLRPFRSDDLPAVLWVERAAFPPLWHMSPAQFERLAGSDSTFFGVCEWDGRVVGYFTAHVGLEGGYVGRLGVHPEYQGQGMGSAMLALSLHLLLLSGARRFELNTQMNNWQSRRLYDRFGFQVTHRHYLVERPGAG